MTHPSRERLALFPLGTVLYPGVVLPLHIFEDRYRRLVRDLVGLPEGAPRRFGVVAIRQGREVGTDGVRALYDVGCTAVVSQVEAYDDGRFDVISAGATRFRLGELDHSQPYLQAEVELLDEPAGEESGVLAGSVAARFRAYRDLLLAGRRERPEPAPDGEPAEGGVQRPEGVGPGGPEGVGQEGGDRGGQEDLAHSPTSRGARRPALPGDPVVLSYLVAAAAVLNLADKQRLLAAPDAAARLRLELELLRSESAILRRLPSLPAVDLVRAGYPLS